VCCSRAAVVLDHISTTSVAVVPSNPSTRTSYKDGWSPVMLGLKIHLEVIVSVLRHCTPHARFKHWRDSATRQRDLKRMADAWRDRVCRLQWPGDKVDQTIWTVHPSPEELSTFNGTNQALARLCATAYRDLKSLLQGRKRSEYRLRISAAVRLREFHRKLGKLKRVIRSLLGDDIPRFSLDTLVVPGFEFMSPSPEELYNSLRDHFSQWYTPTYSDIPDELWSRLHEWPTLRRHCLRTHGSAYSEKALRALFWGLQRPQRAAAVAQSIGDLFQCPPTLEEFTREIRTPRPLTTGGMSGLTYQMMRLWPPEVVRAAYVAIRTMWQSGHIPDMWKWRWLVPIPKGANSDIGNLRPIMLLEVTRKAWASLIMSKIRSALIRHGVLSPAQHAFLPGRSVETASVQVRNVVEAAPHLRQDLYISSWDIRRAFDSAFHQPGMAASGRPSPTGSLDDSAGCG